MRGVRKPAIRSNPDYRGLKLFADWDMCARRFTDLEDPAQATARLSPVSMDPVKLMAFLVQIANQTRAALAA